MISVAVGPSGQTTQFIYDGDGNLVKKINPNNSKTLYVGGIYEVDKASGGSVTRTVTYYPVGGAMRINNTLYYILKDHLGSASVVTDASGTEVGEQRYYPFGETRLTTGTIYTDKLFTGQREMAGFLCRAPGLGYPVITAGGREMIFGFLKRDRIGASLPTSMKITPSFGAFSSM